MNRSITLLATAFLLPSLLAGAAAAGTVSGHVRDGNGAGIQGVDIDVFDAKTGKKLVTPNDDTGVGGSFSVNVPSGVYRIAFDPSEVTSTLFAPAQVLDVVVSGATDLGDVALGPGIVLSGRVTGPGGAGVAGADLDLIDSSTGVKAFTPKDDSDAQGNFSFVAAKGTWIVQVQPPVASKLVSKRLAPASLTTNTALGTIGVEAGVWISGTVRTTGGLPVEGADLDVLVESTAQSAPLLDDVTAANGSYRIVAPIATVTVAAIPPPGSPYAPAAATGLAATQDLVVDLVLPVGGGDATPTLLASNQTFSGAFDLASEVDAIEFEAVAGMQLLLLGRRGKGGVPPLFELLAPSDAPVALSGSMKLAKTATRVTKLSLPETGVYRLRCFSSGGSGPYSVKLRLLAPPTLRKVQVVGTIATPGAVVEIPFLAQAGSTASVRVWAKPKTVVPSIDAIESPVGAVLDLAGAVKQGKTSATIPGKGIAIPATGDNVLRVGGAAGTTGDFTARVNLRFPKTKPGLVAET